MRAADLAVLVCDATEAQRVLRGVPRAGQGQLARSGAAALGHLAGAGDVPLRVFVNKMDAVAADAPPPPPPAAHEALPCEVWRGSALHDRGIDALLDALGAHIAAHHAADAREPPLVTEARHAHVLRQVLAALDTFAAAYGEVPNPDVTLAAEELRHAAYLVGHLTGETLAADEVLGAIFARFCVGK